MGPADGRAAACLNPPSQKNVTPTWKQMRPQMVHAYPLRREEPRLQSTKNTQTSHVHDVRLLRDPCSQVLMYRKKSAIDEHLELIVHYLD